MIHHENKCVLVHRTKKAGIRLRRFVIGRYDCPLSPGRYGYHNRIVDIEDECDWPSTDFDGVGEERNKDDPRWPTHCYCGYEFSPDDCWQYNKVVIYATIDDSIREIINDLPPGAMWFENSHSIKTLNVMTMAGKWSIDNYLNTPNGWKWTGNPPEITVQGTAVLFGQYECSLVDGILRGWRQR